ncbi:MAG TPA: tetratricopeptide repeat protein [Longimicrobium sp.]|jgi:tetratricopeptide (TPR) repeat protein
MRTARRSGYGVSLVLMAVLMLALAGVAVARLLRVEPALQVNVFGIAGGGSQARDAASDIRAAGPAVGMGRLPADLGLPLAFRYGAAPASPALVLAPPAAWTTLGLGAGESGMLGRARVLAGQGQAQAALALYDSVLARQPANDDVAVERARVLSWSGRTAAAGEVLAAVARRRGDPALRVEAARNLYWAGEMDRADELLDDDDEPAGLASAAAEEAPAAGSGRASAPVVATTTSSSTAPTLASAAAPARRALPGSAAALRDSIRNAANPSVARARRWVRQRNGAMENLALARAYVRERRPAASLAPYRTALRLGARDSLRLELASAALQADSPAVAAVAFGEWLERNPGDRDTRLQRARALAWSRDYPAAAREYARVLDGRDDPAVRYELGEALAFGGDTVGARSNLERVVGADPRNARAHRLLGDLDRWSGRWTSSLARYRSARELDASLEGVDAAMAESREGLRREREARVAGLPDAGVRADGMGDSEGFRRASVEGTRQWVNVDDGSTLAVRARTDRMSAVEPGAEQGVAVSAEAARSLGPVRATGGIGVEAFAGHVLPTALASVSYGSGDGTVAALRVVREGAVRRTATAASVEAGVVSSRVEASGATPLGGVTVEAMAGAERLSSEAGETDRLEASVAATRAVTENLRLSLSASGMTTSAAAPVVEGRTLYWSPRKYVQMQLAAALRRRMTRTVEVEVRAAPGAAWVEERAGARRFNTSGILPALALGSEVRYGVGTWSVNGAADFSAVGTRGYRSLSARVYLSRAVRVR